MGVLKLNKKLLTSILITIFYAIITLICVLHHETWVDEAQVWLLAKHLSVPKLFIHLVNEGHPSFLYLLTMPFAKIFNDIIWLKLLCFFASVASVFMIWQFSPFKTLTKIIVTLSAPFLYFFPVIARSYSFVPLFCFILAYLHSKTDKHPYLYAITLSLLANTHAIMYCFCCLLAFFYIKDNCFKNKPSKESVISSSIIVAGLFALFIQLAGTASSNVAITFVPNTDKLASFARVIMLFLYNSFDDYIIKSSKNYFTIYPLTMLLLTLFGYAFSLFVLFKNSKKFFTVFVLSAAFQIGIYTFMYSYLVFPTRIYCVYMILLFCFWAILKEKEQNNNKKNVFFINAAIIIVFFLTSINGLKSYFGDISYDYTSSKRTADFIKHNSDPEKSLYLTGSLVEAGALVYYLYPEYKLHSIYDGHQLKYIVWNKASFSALTSEQYLEAFKAARKQIKDKDLYVIIAFNSFYGLNMYNLDENYFELLYVSPNALTPSESFKIYKYKK